MDSEPQLAFTAVRDVDLAVYSWPGAGRPLVFAHATGFHARCWDAVIGDLPGRQRFAMDMRGHGLSAKPEPPYHWLDFGLDVAALADAYDWRGAIGVGHSAGGHAMAVAAAHQQERFAALILVDPVILPEEYYDAEPLESHFASRRRNEWPGPEAMYERFKDREPFCQWDQRVLHDYCTYGLLPSPDGFDYVLACPPEVEASIYINSVYANIYPLLGQVRCPVWVVRSNRAVQNVTDMMGSPTVPDLARHFARGQDLVVDASHFVPMEQPALVARLVREVETVLG